MEQPVTLEVLLAFSGGFGLVLSFILALMAGFRGQVLSANKETKGELSAAKATLFAKLDIVRAESEADAKAVERALAAYKLEAAEKFVTMTHLHGVEVRIDAALRDIGSDVKHLLRSWSAAAAAERKDWEPGD